MRQFQAFLDAYYPLYAPRAQRQFSDAQGLLEALASPKEGLLLLDAIVLGHYQSDEFYSRIETQNMVIEKREGTFRLESYPQFSPDNVSYGDLCIIKDITRIGLHSDEEGIVGVDIFTPRGSCLLEFHEGDKGLYIPSNVSSLVKEHMPRKLITPKRKK